MMSPWAPKPIRSFQHLQPWVSPKSTNSEEFPPKAWIFPATLLGLRIFFGLWWQVMTFINLTTLCIENQQNLSTWGKFSSSTSARLHQIVYAHHSNKYFFGHFGHIFELVLCFESNMVAWTCPKQYISIKSIPFWYRLFGNKHVPLPQLKLYLVIADDTPLSTYCGFWLCQSFNFEGWFWGKPKLGGAFT